MLGARAKASIRSRRANSRRASANSRSARASSLSFSAILKRYFALAPQLILECSHKRRDPSGLHLASLPTAAREQTFRDRTRRNPHPKTQLVEPTKIAIGSPHKLLGSPMRRREYNPRCAMAAGGGTLRHAPVKFRFILTKGVPIMRLRHLRLQKMVLGCALGAI